MHPFHEFLCSKCFFPPTNCVNQRVLVKTRMQDVLITQNIYYKVFNSASNSSHILHTYITSLIYLYIYIKERESIANSSIEITKETFAWIFVYTLNLCSYEEVLHTMGHRAVSIVDNDLAILPRKVCDNIFSYHLYPSLFYCFDLLKFCLSKFFLLFLTTYY